MNWPWQQDIATVAFLLGCCLLCFSCQAMVSVMATSSDNIHGSVNPILNNDVSLKVQPSEMPTTVVNSPANNLLHHPTAPVGLQHQQLPQHHLYQHHHQQQQQQHHHQQQHHLHHSGHGPSIAGKHNQMEARNSYAMLSQAMQEAVEHEINESNKGGTTTTVATAPDGACAVDDLACLGAVHDRLGLEAIRSLHQQLDDDENGNIDLNESDDFLREELKYDSGYEKRHKTFHYNDDTQISVKELWEAWLRSEVHNWTVEQTTDWLAQSVQLPQYVELFQKHKVCGETLPRLAVHNMHYVSTILGIRDPIHKQKIALKAMDVVLFGPPRETGTRWKDYFLVILLLTAIIGCWYAYQQNKNDKRHLRRMAKEMEGLQRAETALSEMQKELELARLEQENVATEKQDLERRLKEAPSLSSSNSDLELQQLRQEIEMLRAELSRAEIELVDNCWTPPVPLQSWLQLTYELESKHAQKKRIMAEKQLLAAREACEKLRRKRSSLVGAFVSTHGKSIDDVDRSIVEARNALSEVTNELQERIHRWKQIESLLGFNIVRNNGLAYLENVLYTRNGSTKSSKNRISGSQDELDDESVQGMYENHGRLCSRDDSSGSDDGDTVTFIVGGGNEQLMHRTNMLMNPSHSGYSLASSGNIHSHNSHHQLISSAESIVEETPLTMSQENVMPLPRAKKPNSTPTYSNIMQQQQSQQPQSRSCIAVAPLPPPRRANSQQSFQLIPAPTTTTTTTITTTINNLTKRLPTQNPIDVEYPEPLSLPAVTSSTVEDSQSTDSSSFDDELKKRRRKLHFSFGRKSQKNKTQ